MAPPLPSLEQVERLPMRAVVAYAARTARRLSSELRGVVGDDVLDGLLQFVDDVATVDLISEIPRASVADAIAHLADAYARAPDNTKTPDKFRVVFALVHSGLAAISVIEAAGSTAMASFGMRADVAKEAQRAVAGIRAVKGETAESLAQAACRDYEVLLRAFGEHDEVTLGEPVYCFDGDNSGDRQFRGHTT